MPKKAKHIFHILMIDDNPGDFMLVEEALKDPQGEVRLHTAQTGREALNYLRKEGGFANRPRPDLIFLDLNLPQQDGCSILAAIKEDPEFKMIPVIVLTSSGAERDIYHSYELHANSYITKPMEFRDLVPVIRMIRKFWLDVATLPPHREAV